MEASGFKLDTESMKLINAGQLIKMDFLGSEIGGIKGMIMKSRLYIFEDENVERRFYSV